MSRLMVAAFVVGITLLPAVPAGAQSARAPDLSIAVVAAPAPAEPGKVLTYRIEASAMGRRPATAVSIESAVPVGTTFDSFVGPRFGWTLSTPDQGGVGTVRATSPVLLPGRSAVFQFSVRVAADVPDGGTILQTATVASARPDPNPADNSASTATPVRVVPPSVADLSVVATRVQELVAVRSTFIASVTVFNNGPSAATDVVVRFPIPEGAVFASATSSFGGLRTPPDGGTGDVLCYVANLPADRTFDLTVIMQVTGDEDTGIALFVEATASSIDPNPNDNTGGAFTSVVANKPAADISVAFVDEQPVVITGDLYVLTVQVHNAGPQSVTEVNAAIRLPDRTRFVDVVADHGQVQGPPRGASGAVRFRVSPMFVDETDTVTIRVRVGGVAGVPLAAAALATSIAGDVDLTNNMDSTSTRVQSLGDAVLAWDPPDPGSADPMPPPTNLELDPNAAGVAKRSTSSGIARRDAPTPIGYTVYASSTPDVQPTPDNMFTTLPPNQTTTTVPVAPGGSFYTVTATYADGESSAPAADGAGATPGPTISMLSVTSTKVTAKGSGFASPVEVLLDGIPFADASKVKSGNTKAVQKGLLLTGQTVQEYTAAGGSFLFAFRNADGGVTTSSYDTASPGKEANAP